MAAQFWAGDVVAVIPVFVSSTFRDFHAERDVLTGPVRERLDDEVREFGCRVEMIDLRWGVDTVGVDEEEAARRVVDVCMSEVARSRPIFLGMLGHRIGYVPDAAHVRWVADRAGVPADQPLEGLSVTELEFGFGLLWDSAPAGDHIVLCRTIDGEVPPGWHDDDPTRVRALRASVGSSTARVHEYRAAVLDDRLDLERVVHLPGQTTSFEDLVVQALSEPVRTRAAALSVRDEDEMTSSERLFRDDHRTMVGRDELVGALVDAVGRGDHVVLVGESGSGKSTVVCAVEQQLRARGVEWASVLLGSGSTGVSARDTVLHLAGQLGYGSELESLAAGAADDEWHIRWQSLLTQIATEDRRTVVVIDALDALSGAREHDDVWPAQVVPDGVGLLCTTTDPTQAQVLVHAGARMVKIDALEPDMAARAAQEWAQVSGRRLPTFVIDEIGSAPRSPLWVRMAVDLLGDIDGDDFARIATEPDQAAAIAHLLLHEVRQFPSEDSLLARLVLDRVVERIGSDSAQTLLTSFAVARSGMAPATLASILGSGANADRSVAVARRVLGSQLRQTDETGRLTFAHAAVRRCITDTLTSSAHSKVIDALATEDIWDTTDVADVMWHSVHAWHEAISPKAASRVTDSMARAMSQWSDGDEHIVMLAIKNHEPGLELIDALDPAALTDHSFDLLGAALDRDALILTPTARFRLAEASLRQARRALPEGSTESLAIGSAALQVSRAARNIGDHKISRSAIDEAFRNDYALYVERRDAVVMQRLSVVIGDLGATLDREGARAEARQRFTEGVEIAREMQRWQIPPATYFGLIVMRSVADAFNNLGEFYRHTGDYEASEQLIREGLDVRRQLVGSRPAHVALITGECESMANLADLLSRRGREQEARHYFALAEAGYRRASQIEPSNPRPRVDLAKTLLRAGRSAQANHQDEAADLLHRTISVAREVTALLPGFVDSVVIECSALYSIATLSGAADTPDEAAGYATAAMRLWHTLPETQRTDSATVSLGNGILTELARQRFDRDDLSGFELLGEGIGLWSEARRSHPESVDAATGLGDALSDYATWKAIYGEYADSNAAFISAAEHLRAGLQVSDSPKARRQLHSTLLVYADSALTQGVSRQAISLCDEMVDNWRHVQPGSDGAAEYLAHALAFGGEIRLKSGDEAGARECFIEADSILHDISSESPRDPAVTAQHVNALGTLAKGFSAIDDHQPAARVCDNLLAVVAGMAKESTDPDVGLKLASALEIVADIRTAAGDLSTADSLYHDAAEHFEHRRDSTASTLSLIKISGIARKRSKNALLAGHAEQARNLCNQALGTARVAARSGQIMAHDELCLSLELSAEIHRSKGDYSTAAQYLEQLLTLRTNDHMAHPESHTASRNLATVHTNLGWTRFFQLDMPQVLHHSAAALGVLRQLNHSEPRSMAVQLQLIKALLDSADWYLEAGDTDAAYRLVIEAISEQQEPADPAHRDRGTHDCAMAGLLGVCLRRLGNPASAIEPLTYALAEYRKPEREPSERRELQVMTELALAHHGNGDQDAGYAILREARDSIEGSGMTQGATLRKYAKLLADTADLYTADGHLDAAIDAYEAVYRRTSAFLEQSPDNEENMRDLEISRGKLAALYLATGRKKAALAAASDALATARILLARDPQNTLYCSDIRAALSFNASLHEQLGKRRTSTAFRRELQALS